MKAATKRAVAEASPAVPSMYTVPWFSRKSTGSRVSLGVGERQRRGPGGRPGRRRCSCSTDHTESRTRGSPPKIEASVSAHASLPLARRMLTAVVGQLGRQGPAVQVTGGSAGQGGGVQKALDGLGGLLSPERSVLGTPRCVGHQAGGSGPWPSGDPRSLGSATSWAVEATPGASRCGSNTATGPRPARAAMVTARLSGPGRSGHHRPVPVENRRDDQVQALAGAGRAHDHGRVPSPDPTLGPLAGHPAAGRPVPVSVWRSRDGDVLPRRAASLEPAWATTWARWRRRRADGVAGPAGGWV